MDEPFLPGAERDKRVTLPGEYDTLEELLD